MFLKLFLMNNFVASSEFSSFLSPLPNNDLNMRTTFVPPVIMVTKNLPKLTSATGNEAAENEETEFEATKFLAQTLNTSNLQLKGKNTVGKAQVFTYEHLKNGLPIINHEAKITVQKSDILAYSHNFRGDITVGDCSTRTTEDEMQEYVNSKFKTVIIPGSSKKVLVDVGNNNAVEAIKMQLASDDAPICELAVDSCNLDIVYYVNYTA